MQHEFNPSAENSIPKRRYNTTTAVTRHSHVKAWKESGLSMSQFCRQHGLAISSFSVWAQNYSKTKDPQPAFKPLVLSDTPKSQTQDSVVEIYFTEQIKLRLLNAHDSQFIVAIAKGLALCN